MNSASNTFIRRFVRPLIPYPRKKTWRKWFPRFEDRNIAFLLKQNNIETLIDVGANTGQFATKMRSSGFRGRLISIEPVSQYHEALRIASRTDPLWDVAPRMGLGAKSGEGSVAIAGALSSFKEFVADAAYETQTVPVTTLDEAFASFDIPSAQKVGLKLDVQGSEKEVLEGGPETLKRCSALLIELSLKPMYRGEAYYLEILSLLHEKGFKAVFFSPVVDQKTLGEMWQVDALLLKQN